MAAAAVSSTPAAHRRVSERVDERAEHARRRATRRWRRWCGLVAGVAGGEHLDAADAVNGEDNSGGPPTFRQAALAEEVEETAAKLAGGVDLSGVDWSEGTPCRRRWRFPPSRRRGKGRGKLCGHFCKKGLDVCRNCTLVLHDAKLWVAEPFLDM